MMSLNGRLSSRLLALNSPIKHGPWIIYAVEVYPSFTDFTIAVLSAVDTLPRTATVYDRFVEVQQPLCPWQRGFGTLRYPD